MGFFSRIFNRADRGRAPDLSFTAETSPVADEIQKVPADNPIQNTKDDLLGRDPIAEGFVRQILSTDFSEGVVVGVLGPWGFGKTSFVNLCRKYFHEDGATILDFNPWMFSGADQLVNSFFSELSAQLKLHGSLAEIGEAIGNYGDLFSGMGWLPFVGAWAERGKLATDIVSAVLKSKKEGVSDRRKKVTDSLRKLNKPIVVVVDDIDRLTTSEIRDIFKLVRLTANFPNIIYLVAFDRGRVEAALEEDGIPGRDYLEKILQLGLDLPRVPEKVFNQQVFVAIDSVLERPGSPGTFTQSRWPDIFVEVVRPLIRNMRDVRRYVAALAGTVLQLEGKVELVDVLALEAIRTFLPDVFVLMYESVGGLTAPSSLAYGGNDSPDLKNQIDKLVGAAGDKVPVVRALIKWVFPAALRHVGGSSYGADWLPRWLRERRAAHESILRFYLERTVGEGLKTFYNAEHAWGLMSEGEALDEYFHSLSPTEWEGIISALESYEDQYQPEHVIPAIVVLLNLWPEMPQRPRGIVDFGTRLVVTRVVYRLIRSLQNPSLIEDSVKSILPQLRTLAAKLELITDVGHKKDQGHGLVPEAVAKEFERGWRDEVRAASPERLLLEKDPIRVIIVANQDSEDDEPRVSIPPNVEFTLTLLKSAKTETVSQSLESRAVHRSPRMAWGALVLVYGNEDILKERVNEVKATNPEGVEDLMSLVDRYMSGTPPTDFDD